MGSLALPPNVPSRTFESIDELQDHLAGWDVEFTQLAAGRIVGSHGAAWVGSTLLQGGRTRVPLIQRGAAPPLATFTVLSSPGTRMISRGRDYTGDHILISRPGDEVHLRTWPDFQVRTLSVDEALLRSVARDSGVEQGVDLALGAASVRPSPRSLARLRQEVFGVEIPRPGSDDAPPPPPSSREHRLLHLLARALASHEGAVEPDRLRRLDRILLEVQAVLSRQPERAFTREELSDAVGVSDRSIRRATQTWYETSPLRLMKVRRLHAARRDLLRGHPRNDRVIDVTTRWGFTHNSRFAGEYTAIFGERPSDTLRRV